MTCEFYIFKKHTFNVGSFRLIFDQSSSLSSVSVDSRDTVQETLVAIRVHSLKPTLPISSYVVGVPSSFWSCLLGDDRWGTYQCRLTDTNVEPFHL